MAAEWQPTDYPDEELTPFERGVDAEAGPVREKSNKRHWGLIAGGSALAIGAVSAGGVAIYHLDTQEKADRRQTTSEIEALVVQDGFKTVPGSIVIGHDGTGRLGLRLPGCELSEVEVATTQRSGHYADVHSYTIEGAAYPHSYVTRNQNTGRTERRITGEAVTFSFDNLSGAQRIFGRNICATLARQSYLPDSSK